MGLSLWLKLGTVKIQFLEDRHGQILPNLSVFIRPDDFPFLSLSRCLPVGRPSHLGCQDKRHEKLLERLSPESIDVEHLKWGHDWPLCCKLSINHLDDDYRSDLTPQHLSTLATDVPLYLQIFLLLVFVYLPSTSFFSSFGLQRCQILAAQPWPKDSVLPFCSPPLFPFWCSLQWCSSTCLPRWKETAGW